MSYKNGKRIDNTDDKGFHRDPNSRITGRIDNKGYERDSNNNITGRIDNKDIERFTIARCIDLIEKGLNEECYEVYKVIYTDLRGKILI